MVLGALPAALRRRPRLLVLAAVLGVLVAAVLTVQSAGQAQGTDANRCQRFRSDSLARASAVTGEGQRVVVIGDSWSAGLGLADSTASWPARLSGRVSVAGFSGSGFSAGASSCGRVSFADRAPAALRRGADLVVVEGGLNDVDQPDRAVVSGLDRLMRVLEGRRVVVVGPAAAPSRARGVPRIDALLSRRVQQWADRGQDVTYVATDDLRLGYLPDRLHLTPTGHRDFGVAVAERIDQQAAQRS